MEQAINEAENAGCELGLEFSEGKHFSKPSALYLNTSISVNKEEWAIQYKHVHPTWPLKMISCHSVARASY